MTKRSMLIRAVAGFLVVVHSARVEDKTHEGLNNDEGDTYWTSRKHCVVKKGPLSVCAAQDGTAHLFLRAFCTLMGGEVSDDGCKSDTDYTCGIPTDIIAKFVSWITKGNSIANGLVEKSDLEFYVKKAGALGCGHVEGLKKMFTMLASVPTMGLNSEATVHLAGAKGDWDSAFHRCPEDEWVIAARQKVERSRGWRDDTAMNAVELKCGDGTVLKSKEGPWGSWTNWQNCDSGLHVVGFSMKSEAPGHRDDTGANGIRLTCSTYGHFTSREKMNFDNEGKWGAWSRPAECPPWQYVCGLKTRVQSKQGSWKNDTALGDVKLACCHYR